MSITLEHLTKNYASHKVLRDVTLEIKTGELFVLLGSSGSGKSTLLRMIAGLTDVDSGRICLNGRDVTNEPPQKRGTGFVFQNYSLFRHMTVAQNIEFGLQVQKAPRQERQKRVQELLRLIGMADIGGRMPYQLSGGQQQRVALARALAPKPNVLLLDEPFGALDVKIRSQLRTSLREIQQQLGVTSILVTHDQDEAFELADRIGIIEQGELLEVGKPSELYRRPQHAFTATFLGSANLMHGRRNGKHVHIGDIVLDAPPHTEHLSGLPVSVLSRPEEITLARSADALKGQLIGRGVVQRVEFAGAVERVSVSLMERNAKNLPDLQAVVSLDDTHDLNITPGQEVWVGLKQFHLLPHN